MGANEKAGHTFCADSNVVKESRAHVFISQLKPAPPLQVGQHGLHPPRLGREALLVDEGKEGDALPRKPEARGESGLGVVHQGLNESRWSGDKVPGAQKKPF